jgi:methyl halide transferase
MQGYDIPFFASKGYKVLGVDISETAIANANKTLASEENKDIQSLCSFESGDFLVMDLGGTFDIVYDDAAFCDLDPSLRTKWATRMAEIVKPGGHLIALIFLVADHPHVPPYSVTPELYEELLSEKFEKVFIRDCPSFPTRDGREKMSMWKRKVGA